jgi:hypothetical protein
VSPGRARSRASAYGSWKCATPSSNFHCVAETAGLDLIETREVLSNEALPHSLVSCWNHLKGFEVLLSELSTSYLRTTSLYRENSACVPPRGIHYAMGYH